MEALRQDDPVTIRLRAIIDAWHVAFGMAEKTLAEAASYATTVPIHPGSRADPDEMHAYNAHREAQAQLLVALREAFAGSRDGIDTRRWGQWDAQICWPHCGRPEVRQGRHYRRPPRHAVEAFAGRPMSVGGRGGRGLNAPLGTETVIPLCQSTDVLARYWISASPASPISHTKTVRLLGGRLSTTISRYDAMPDNRWLAATTPSTGGTP